MALSVKAIIAIIGVFITLPPTVIIVWAVMRRRNNVTSRLQGMKVYMWRRVRNSIKISSYRRKSSISALVTAVKGPELPSCLRNIRHMVGGRAIVS
ncbi:hypothetical protein MMC31_001571 [Peltigera leucophlebia]|nr:hypothetical protein [Peltigera leucophlebia]